MKVLLTMDYTMNPSWGLENFAYNLIEGLKKIHNMLEKRDINVTILSPRGRTYLPKKVNFEEYPQIELFTHRMIPPLAYSAEFQYLFKLKKYIDKKFDIIHSHDLNFSITICSFLRKEYPKLIHTIHGLPWNEIKYANNLYAIASYSLNIWRLKKLASYDIPFTSVSRYSIRNIIQTIRPSMIFYIPNPISEEFFNVKKTYTCPPILLYPTRLIPIKNHISLIKALGILKSEGYKDILLALTGDVEDVNYYHKIKKTIELTELNNNVTFLGNLSREKLLEWYSKASVVVSASLRETFSLIVAESMATGTPVVASPVGIVPETIVHGKNGIIINPHDPQNIAESIRILLEDPKKRKIIGKEGKKTAEKWKSKHIAKEFIKLWEIVYTHEGTTW